ncbi:ParA family protein [Bradyrhizobium sp. AZCC 1708]|uniref:ParA family protein n=1 Tax=Bradyrhizobium sp. AZCC 1708 TaxID=3117015 RepID=UPI002FEF8B0B
MKTIATINFKGGVGKTTSTWALGHVAAQSPQQSSLVFDLDAQMSLTQSIALNEDGNPFKNFTDWYEKAIAKKKTIFDALDEFTKTSSTFNFGINHDFIYRIADRYHFVPSVEDLYWTELEVWDREKVKFFIQRLLEKIRNSKNVPEYNTVLFDCPPSFSLLSYSILSCCNLVLIPINPDFFAAKGLNLLLSTLRARIEPFPVPKIGVFMNRAKPPGGGSSKRFSNETQRYLDDAKLVVKKVGTDNGLNAKVFETAIFDRVGMKRAIQEGMPPAFNQQFSSLWQEIQSYL